MKKLIVCLTIPTALVLFVGCGSEPTDDSSGCAADAECKGERICVDGHCVTPDSGDSSSNNQASNSQPSSNQPSNNQPSNNQPSNNTSDTNDGGLGSSCTIASECDSSYCRTPAGAFDGTCSVNDFGEMCQGNSDCEYGACLFANDTDDFGYCTAQCESFSDCPSFWDCEEVGNANGTYCIQG